MALDNSALIQLVESLRQTVFIPVGRLGQQFARERAAYSAGHPGQVIGRLRKLGEPGADDRLNAQWRRFAHASQPGAHTLHHEERVAPGGAIEFAQLGSGYFPIRHLCGQNGGLMSVERRERDLSQLPRLTQLGSQPCIRMLASGLFGPQRSQHQNSRRGRRPEQAMEPLEVESGLVAPLHVVDKQEQRLARLAEHSVERVVKREALPAFGQGTRTRQRGILLQNLR